MKQSMLFFAVLLAISFIFAENSIAEKAVTGWNAMSRLEKRSFINGYRNGRIEAQMEIALELNADPLVLAAITGLPKDCDRKCMGSISEFADNEAQSIRRKIKTFVNADIGQVVDGVDKFYTDYRNQNILPSDLIGVAIESISGSSAELIEKRLQFFREVSSKN
jgi:hypothetical protein